MKEGKAGNKTTRGQVKRFKKEREREILEVFQKSNSSGLWFIVRRRLSKKCEVSQVDYNNLMSDQVGFCGFDNL